MRTVDEAERFQSIEHGQTLECKKCKGQDANCDCFTTMQERAHLYEACIPAEFWNSQEKQIEHNVEIFNNVIKRYCKRLKTAAARGYSLLLLGSNGVGKTMFISWILREAVRRGLTAYYTTLPSLDYHIKRGFDDKHAAARLEYMMTSNFVAIDELAAERFKGGDSFMRVQLERILKQKYGDHEPVILASNAPNVATLRDVYGPAIGSLLEGGRYESLVLEDGDFRAQQRDKMRAEMGFKK